MKFLAQSPAARPRVNSARSTFSRLVRRYSRGAILCSAAGLFFMTLPVGCIQGGMCQGDACDGGGGGGGGGGGMGGSASEFPCASKAANVRTRSLEGCSAHATVEAFENDLLRPKCANNAACHRANSQGSSAYAPTIANQDAFVALAGVKTTRAAGGRLACSNSDFIDMNTPRESWLLKKLDDPVTCPSDANANDLGARMPGKVRSSDPDMFLTADERACFEAYAVAVAAGCR